MRRFQFIFTILLIAVASLAQDVRQIGGSGGSVAGTSSGGSFRVTGIAGQPAIGEIEGGPYHHGSGWSEIWAVPGVILDAEQPEEALPADYSFPQNYPNPFNPATTFEFALPRASHVRLVIYDVLGRESSRLLNADLAPGRHRLEFVPPPSMASGVYFAVFDAAEFHIIRKLMLIK